MFLILSQLNILCTSPLKPYYAENNNNLPSTWHGTYLLCNLPDFIETECSIYQNVQYFLRNKSDVLNLMAFIGYTVDILNKCWPTDVHNQRWFRILTGNWVQQWSTTAWINWYLHFFSFFSMVSLKLCEEYLNMSAFKYLKGLNIMMRRTPSHVITYRSYRLVNTVRFFAHHVLGELCS